MDERNGLRERVGQHNAQCSAVEEGSSAAARCQSELDTLSAALSAHIASSNSFNDAVEAAEAATPNYRHVPIGSAADVRGAVYWLTSDGRRVPITTAGQVYSGARIVSGPGSRLQVKLLDGTTFTIGENSDMVLDDFVYDTDSNLEKFSAQLTKGIFRWVTGKVAHKDPANMKVTCPLALSVFAEPILKRPCSRMRAEPSCFILASW